MCEKWCLLLSTLSAELRRGEKEQLSHVQENILVQTDLGFLFLCCVYMSLWMHAPLGVYKSVWGIESYPAGEADVCGTWVLGFEFWPWLLSSNHSEPLSHPSSPGFRVLKALKFLVAVIVTYFNHFQSWWSKMSSGPRRHVSALKFTTSEWVSSCFGTEGGKEVVGFFFSCCYLFVFLME